MMSNYDKKKIAIVEKSSEILAILAGVFLCVSTIFMFANMLTRTVADFNIRFVYELCGLCAAGTASFAIPYATFKSAHSQMDIITSHMKHMDDTDYKAENYVKYIREAVIRMKEDICG